MGAATKKEMVREMFDDIAPRYDFLNHFLSLGIDKLWRSRLVRMLATAKPGTVLDVATGTGDLAIAIARAGRCSVTGIDISEGMLEAGIAKVGRLGLKERVTLRKGDAESIPFPDAHFDAVTVAFGVRNFGDLAAGLREMRRVLKPGGVMLILEFSQPGRFPVKQLYRFYSGTVIPMAGRIISGHSKAYTYLPESAAAFPSGKAFLDILGTAGLISAEEVQVSQGIATIYKAEK